MKTILAALLLAALPACAGAQTLTATSTAAAAGQFYRYDYVFSITGPAGTAVDNLYLGTADLSPLGPFTYLKNGAATTDWSFASNDTPSSYLDFFSVSDSLGSGDRLEVQLVSAYAPTLTGTASGYDTANGRYTLNTVSGLSVPVPEAATTISLGLLLALGGAGLIARRRV